MPERESLPV